MIPVSKWPVTNASGEGSALTIARLRDVALYCNRYGMTPLVEFGGIALHPTKHRGVIDGDLSLPHKFFDISITQHSTQSGETTALRTG
jgi:hypothetical protein